MIKTRNYETESGVERVITFSDQNMMIKREGVLYGEADDFAYQNRTYTETDIPIDSTDEQTETEQKAKAFDYLTGRNDENESIS